MIVDDERDSLRLMTDALEAADITVLIATSGAAALQLLAHIPPDLILMDAVMPEMDGFETTLAIKKNPKLAHIPVIFMTGLTASEHVVEAFEVGGVDYVRKPANIQELLARVRVHMAQGRAQHASVASLDATGRLMLATDTRGRFLWCSPLAERAIARIAPGWSKEDVTLPLQFTTAIERVLARRAMGVSSVRIEQPLGTLELVLIAQYRENEVLIRLNELNPDEHAAQLKLRLQITDREAEVLLWLSYGKSSGDISDVLSISPRTVQKHLERIFEKLGVETRAAAAAMAIRAIDQ
ncbi:MAG: response regulator [Sphingomonas bacterium]